jgi:hypothetical protein
MTLQPESEDEGEDGDQAITVESVARENPVLAGAPDDEDNVKDLETEDDMRRTCSYQSLPKEDS